MLHKWANSEPHRIHQRKIVDQYILICSTGMRVVPLVWTKSVRKIDIFLFEKRVWKSDVHTQCSIFLKFWHLLHSTFGFKISFVLCKFFFQVLFKFFFYIKRKNFLNRTLCRIHRCRRLGRRKIDDRTISTAKLVYPNYFNPNWKMKFLLSSQFRITNLFFLNITYILV